MDPEAPPPAPPRQLAAALVLALAAAALVKVALHAALPGPADPLARAKLVQLGRQRDAIDTLFVGSSLTYRGVSPAAFDAVTATASEPTRSYNLGMPALGPLELDYVLDRIAAAPPPKLRWVFVECGDLAFEHDWGDESTERVAYWHDARRTAFALQSLAWQRGAIGTRFRQAKRHAHAFLHDLFEVGRLRLFAAHYAETGRVDPGDPRTLGAKRDGFRSYEEELATADDETRDRYSANRGALLHDRVGFEASVRALAMHRATPLPLDPGAIELYARARATIERMGAHAIFLVPPMRAQHTTADAAERQGVLPVLLRFNEPGRYPALFAFDRWWDRTHLDEKGALLYTRALADQFALLARTQRAP